MKPNFKNGTIELTTTEAKKASTIGSDLYNQLVQAKADFPTYKVVVLPQRKSKRTDTLKGLNYSFMDNYVAEHANEEQFEEYANLRSKEETNGKAIMTYGEIKKWFLSQFPEILNKRKELKSIIAASTSTTTIKESA